MVEDPRTEVPPYKDATKTGPNSLEDLFRVIALGVDITVNYDPVRGASCLR